MRCIIIIEIIYAEYHVVFLLWVVFVELLLLLVYLAAVLEIGIHFCSCCGCRVFVVILNICHPILCVV